MNTMNLLAIRGARPRFERALVFGQQHWPDWNDYRTLFSDIFERQYYTNHGPLAQALEQRLAQYLGVRHAICVSNEYIGLALLAQALDLHGAVIVPAHVGLASVQPLDWADSHPLFCDVDPRTGLLDVAAVQQLARERQPSAVLGLNPWGDACALAELDAWAAQAGVPVFYDSSQALACQVNGQMLGGFGRAEVMSFQADQVLGAGEGGLITTQDDELAAKVRNIRSNYGMGRPVPVAKTGNGRMSEAQAALALYNLDRLPAYLASNHAMRRAYEAGLQAIPGLRLRASAGVELSNAQSLVVLVDSAQFGLDAASVVRVLAAENIVARQGLIPAGRPSACDLYGQPLEHFPAARHYAQQVLELPMHSSMQAADIDKVLDCLSVIQSCAPQLRVAMGWC